MSTIRDTLNKIFDAFLKLKTEVKAIVIVVVLVVLWMLSGVFSSHKEESNTISGANDISAAYETKTSFADIRTAKLTLNGTVEAVKVVELRAEGSGYVEKVLADEGALLMRDEVIVELESKSTVENLENAKAKLERAQLAANSEMALFKRGLGSEIKVASTKAELARARADLTQAQYDADNTKITMPFNGIVDTVYVEQGDLIDFGSQQAVARVISAENYKVICFIPEKDIIDVQNGQEVVVKVGDKQIKGKIMAISQVANPNTKTFDAEVVLDNAPETLRTGMGVSVQVPTKTIMAHYIPLSALNLNDGGEVTVKYLQSNVVSASVVKLIEEDADGVWVSGLPERAEIIIRGGSNLKNGLDVGAFKSSKGSDVTTQDASSSTAY